MALVYCFLFMEETNYDRLARPVEYSATLRTLTGSEVAGPQGRSGIDEKSSKMATVQNPSNTITDERETGQVFYPRKTYIQKLRIKDKSRPNRMVDIALCGLTGFSYPSVLYAGYAISQQWRPYSLLTEWFAA